jgi:hypothetical protein
MRLALLATAACAALLAGCATEGGYYTTYSSPYYGYGYGYDYYPDYYYDYGPAYYSPGFSFTYRGGEHHWNGTAHHWSGASSSHWSGASRSFHGERGGTTAHSRTRTHVASGGGHFERGARHPALVASGTRTGPDREHGG